MSALLPLLSGCLRGGLMLLWLALYLVVSHYYGVVHAAHGQASAVNVPMQRQFPQGCPVPMLQLTSGLLKQLH